MWQANEEISIGSPRNPARARWQMSPCVTATNLLTPVSAPKKPHKAFYPCPKCVKFLVCRSHQIIIVVEVESSELGVRPSLPAGTNLGQQGRNVQRHARVWQAQDGRCLPCPQLRRAIKDLYGHLSEHRSGYLRLLLTKFAQREPWQTTVKNVAWIQHIGMAYKDYGGCQFTSPA